MAYRTESHEAADELCSCYHLNAYVGMVGDTLVAQFLGLDNKCIKWVTPFGEDVTALCEESDHDGTFNSTCWSLQGWVLDEESVQKLMEEFPDRYPLQHLALNAPACHARGDCGAVNPR